MATTANVAGTPPGEGERSGRDRLGPGLHRSRRRGRDCARDGGDGGRGFAIAGDWEDGDDGYDLKGWLLKADPTGRPVWSTIAGSQDWSGDFFWDVATGTDGGIAGLGRGGTGFIDQYEARTGRQLAHTAWLYATDPTGTEVINRSFGNEPAGEFYDGVGASDGGYLLAGRSGDVHTRFLKTTASGEIAWETGIEWEGSPDPRDFDLLRAGDRYYATGAGGVNNTDAFVTRIDAGGEVGFTNRLESDDWVVTYNIAASID